tara:strand:+ start:253 stop:2304 length:2052 start_codon:yes stop_codon:yes gene_type:complete
MISLPSKGLTISIFKRLLINIVLLSCFINPNYSEAQSSQIDLPINRKPNASDQEYYGDTFGQAEHLYHSGKILTSKSYYHKYLLDSSNKNVRQKVFFRLGLIDQNEKSFATALWYYQMLIDSNPNSLLANEVKFNMAVCNYELGNYDKAGRLFNIIIRQSFDKKQKWYALYYLSKLDARNLNFEDAFQKLKHIYLHYNDEKLGKSAFGLAEEMIDEKFNEKKLSSLIQKYKVSFPVDLLLLKKISIHREKREVVPYILTAKEFIKKFPQHEKSDELKRQLESFQKEAGNDNIEVGVVLPLTGKLAATGQQVLQGIQLAYSLLPESTRDKISLNVKDSSQSILLEKILYDLAMNPKIVGILGPLLSDEIKRSAEIADSFKLPIFTPTASSSDLVSASPYVFRNSLTRKIQAQYLAEYSINKLKLKRIAVLYPSEPFGEELKSEFIQAVEGLGGEIVGMASYDRSQNDFKAQILELGGIGDDDLDRLTRKQLSKNEVQEDFSDPAVLSRPKIDMAHWSGDKIENLKVSLELSYDAIFIPGVYDKVGLIIPQLAFYNIENISLLGANGWNSPELIKMGGKFLKSIYFVDGFYSDSNKINVGKFVQQFQNNYGEPPSQLSAQAYDAAGMIFQGINLGGKNRLKLKEKLLKIQNYQGVTGKTYIKESGDSAKEIFALTVKNKKIVEDN